MLACLVALFTRAWIEIYRLLYCGIISVVALFTRAWIEITPFYYQKDLI